MLRTIAVPFTVHLLLLLVATHSSCIGASNPGLPGVDDDVDDYDDFAEFEDLDDETPSHVPSAVETDAEDDVVIDDVDSVDGEVDDDVSLEDDDLVDESEVFDEEEFEGVDGQPTVRKPGQQSLHLHQVVVGPGGWERYQLEILMVTGLLAYILNYLIGRNHNSQLAQTWFAAHRELLEANFSLIGDTGTEKEAVSTLQLNQENDHVFSLWCSGRVCCEGMLVHLKLLKRQDLLSLLARMMRPAIDQIQIVVTMTTDDMENLVFALGSKKAMSRLHKDMQDLSYYCGEKPRSAARYHLPDCLNILSESGEVSDAILDEKMINFLKNSAEKIESIHFSDQYSGVKVNQEEGQNVKLPETQKSLLFTFNVPGMGKATNKDMEGMLPLMKMVIYSIDKMKKIRLSKEAKLKSERNRARVAEAYQKLSHAQRQEAAQARREERRRAEKQRIMDEEDPEKQRRLEEAQLRKDQKKLERKQIKMKQLKVKAM